MSAQAEAQAIRVCNLYAILRVRGIADVPPDVDYTLKLLRLHKPNHLVLYPIDMPGIQGMLQKVKDWVTWGEIEYSTLVELLEKRGRAMGNRKLTAEYILQSLGVGSVAELAEMICKGDLKLHQQEKIKPVFRLKPPSKGYKLSIKKPYKSGGELGYRGLAINELIKRMI
jgi:large subunit ribosomal protein L30